MDFECITKGGIYDLRIVVEAKRDNALLVCTLSDDEMQDKPRYVLHRRDACDLRPIPPKNGTKNTEPEPKYDPCRKFRKGDRVELKEEIDGRKLSDFVSGLTLGKVYTVEEDEKDCTVVLSCDCGLGKYSFVHLRLVTPVEELERYVLLHNEFSMNYEVCWKDDDEQDGQTGRTRCRAQYWYHLPPQTYSQKEAKAAAEAECARLNAEYRKEVEK